MTAHMPGIAGNQLAALLEGTLFRSTSGVERGDLYVETDDRRRLELGAFARWPAGAS
jgi:hypothetical protein